MTNKQFPLPPPFLSLFPFPFPFPFLSNYLSIYLSPPLSSLSLSFSLLPISACLLLLSHLPVCTNTSVGMEAWRRSLLQCFPLQRSRGFEVSPPCPPSSPVSLVNRLRSHLLWVMMCHP